MNKLKRIVSIFLSIILLTPILITLKPNNVYADVGGTPINNTISAASYVRYHHLDSGSGSTNDSNTSENYDLRKYDRASFTWSCSIKDNRGNGDWAVSYVSMTMTDKNSGEVLKSFSKRYNNPPEGSWNGPITWDLAALKTNGKDLSNIVFTSAVKAGTTFDDVSIASVSDVTLVALSPVITGVLANGDSCVQSNGNLTPVKFRINIIQFFHLLITHL